MRTPFKKHLNDIPIEEAHGGSGKRQMILSNEDPVSTQLQAMTKGFLPAEGVFEWHGHEGVDEFFLVLAGEGVIEFEDGKKITYKQDDLIYIPSGSTHKITNTGRETGEFFFIRLNH